MDKTDEMIKKWEMLFENHEATVQEVDEHTQILTWKQKDTIIYSLEFIFRDNRIYIGGDLGWGTFSTTWKPRWNYNWESIDSGYFAEKCTSVKNGKQLWDEDSAIEELKERYRYLLDDPDNFEDVFNKVMNSFNCFWSHWNDWDDIESEIDEAYNTDLFLIKQMYCVIKAVKCSSSKEEYIFNLKSNPDFDDHDDFWEWGYSVGDVLNGYFIVWLTALRMARKQLIEKGYGANYE